MPKTIKLVKPTEFTIRMRSWLRGEDSQSYLHRSDDHKQCCLGFYARACGVPLKNIVDVSLPNELYSEESPLAIPSLVNKKDGEDLKIVEHFTDVNDDTESTDETKIKKITSLFKRIGVKVNFVK